MDTAFFPILAATTAKITAPATEWKALLKLLPPCEEVLPLFKKIAGSARFFTEFPAGSPGLEPREECGLSTF